MYNVTMQKVNKSQASVNNLLQSEPISAQQNRSVLNSEFIVGSRNDSGQN